jgi:hypothetical protein
VFLHIQLGILIYCYVRIKRKELQEAAPVLLAAPAEAVAKQKKPQLVPSQEDLEVFGEFER